MQLILKLLGQALIAIALSCVVVANAEEGEEAFAAIFDDVWIEIDENHYDPRLIDPEQGGVDWKAVGNAYREKLNDIENRSDLYDLLNRMLGELGESHYAIVEAGKDDFATPKWEGGYSGIELTAVGGKAIVLRVDKDSPAAEAGIKPGFELIGVDGVKSSELHEKLLSTGVDDNLASIYWIRKLLGRINSIGSSKTKLQMSANDAGETEEFSFQPILYTGRTTGSIGNIPDLPISMDSYVTDDGVGYLRFSIWFPVLMEDIRKFVRNLPDDTKGLIIDLRGNPGGLGMMAGGLAGMLVEERLLIGQTVRGEGYLNINGYPQKGAFLGPVAILQDGGSASTSEIFAAGMQEGGRAKVFGKRSAGAALPSIFKELPSGVQMQVVVMDCVTESGVRIEGVGVTPDVELELSLESLLNEKDNVIDSARNWILEQ